MEIEQWMEGWACHWIPVQDRSGVGFDQVRWGEKEQIGREVTCKENTHAMILSFDIIVYIYGWKDKGHLYFSRVDIQGYVTMCVHIFFLEVL